MKFIRREWLENVFSERVKNEQVNVIWAPAGAGKTTFVKYMCRKIYKQHSYYVCFSGINNESTINYKLKHINNIVQSIPNSMVVVDHCDVLFSNNSLFPLCGVGKIILIMNDKSTYNRFPLHMKIHPTLFQWANYDLHELGYPKNSTLQKYSNMAKTPAFHLKVLSGKYSNEYLFKEARYLSSLWNQQ